MFLTRLQNISTKSVLFAILLLIFSRSHPNEQSFYSAFVHTNVVIKQKGMNLTASKGASAHTHTCTLIHIWLLQTIRHTLHIFIAQQQQQQQHQRTEQWHMWKFLRVHILSSSHPQPSKNKLYFNMHCVLE